MVERRIWKEYNTKKFSKVNTEMDISKTKVRSMVDRIILKDNSKNFNVDLQKMQIVTKIRKDSIPKRVSKVDYEKMEELSKHTERIIWKEDDPKNFTKVNHKKLEKPISKIRTKH